MWFVVGLLNVFAVVVLIVDHAQYPGNPADPNTEPAPEYMVVLRDVAFFILVISAILLMVRFIRTYDFAENRLMGAFAVANMMFFIASIVYMFVYRYELDFSAQQGSAASNFYYAAIGYIGLIVFSFTVLGCTNDPFTCSNFVGGMFELLRIFA